MEPEQTNTIDEASEPQLAIPPPPVKPAKNPKRVAAGKKLVEHNKKAKEKMLEDIAEANANASKANANANEAVTTLKGYLEQQSAQTRARDGISLQEYQTPIIISGVLLLAGLYLWSSKRGSTPYPSPGPQQSAVDAQGHQTQPVIQPVKQSDDIYAI